MLQWAMPTAPSFWAAGPGIWVVRQGLSASLRARGKAPVMEAALPPPEMDEKLVQWLQDEEVASVEAQLGRDTATLKVVMEAAGPLAQGQV